MSWDIMGDNGEMSIIGIYSNRGNMMIGTVQQYDTWVTVQQYDTWVCLQMDYPKRGDYDTNKMELRSYLILSC